MMKVVLSFVFTVCVAFVGKADPGDNWPWGAEMPFPWKGIQGTWAFYYNNNLAYMSFKVIKNTQGSNQLEMVLYDGERCKVLSNGGGWEEERVVHGLMLSPRGAARMITIHVFSEATMKAVYGNDWRPEGRKSRSYTVLNVSTFDSNGSESFQLEKVHYSPYGICPEKKRNQK